MFKVIVSLLIALIILWFVRILFYIICYTIKFNNRMKMDFSNKKSEYREAFEMECSREMIKGDGFAKNLNKAIEKIDKENERLRRRKAYINKKIV